MNNFVESEKNLILTSKPVLNIERAFLYTEGFVKNKEKQSKIRHAKALYNVLEKMPLKIENGEILVGHMLYKYPGANLYPEGIGLRIIPEIDDLENRYQDSFIIDENSKKLLKEFIEPVWKKNNIEHQFNLFIPKTLRNIIDTGSLFIPTELAGISHFVPNYPLLINKGINSLIYEINEKLEKDPSNDEYNAMLIVLDGILNFSKRYSKLAEKIGNKNNDENLLEISEILEKIPANPPSTFKEALQFIWLFQIALHMETYEQAISFGRIDHYLYPFYAKDLKKGIISKKSAKELISQLWVRTNEILPLFDSFVLQYFSGTPTNQALTLGPDYNELSYIMMDVTQYLSMRQPNVHLRISTKTSEKDLSKISDLISSGNNVFAIFNDGPIINSFLNRGFSRSISKNYSTVGCVEFSIPGMSFTSSDSLLFNMAMPLELLLNDGKSIVLDKKFCKKLDLDGIKSFKEFMEAYKEILNSCISLMDRAQKALEKANALAKPTPLVSVTVEGPLDKGIDVTEGGAKYNGTGIQFVGFADVVDSLYSIKKLVFENKIIDLKSLKNILKQNFETNLSILGEINNLPKYGQDIDEIDEIAKTLTDIIYEILISYTTFRKGKYIAGAYPMTTFIGFGYFTGALPSGRLEGEPLSNGISPTSKATDFGITANINSVLKVDWSKFENGVSHTIDIISGLAKPEIIKSILKVWSKNGGMHLQFNVLDANSLKDAINHPEKYPNLLVRVAGWSARFIDLSRDVQEDIIKRLTEKE